MGRRTIFRLLLSLGLWGMSRAGRSAEVAVRYPEGLAHGFLSLRSFQGAILADGDLIQSARGDRVTSRLLLRFNDGSVHDETVVFTQDRTFRVVTDHLLQKGPAFPQPVEVWIDAPAGTVKVRYDDHGEQRVVSEKMDLPPDLANGLVLTLLKNVDPREPFTRVSLIAATPKPRLVHLVLTPSGEDGFRLGGSSRQATHFVAHVEIGGLAGLVAPILGKQPPDTHVWILEGDAPAFIGSEGPLATGGDPWRLELASPAAPKTSHQ